ncbi:hypothetical protein DL96DRAFT_1603885 [Flagelloscypha sp. PMI_526]|nr:hypothetical protein DL96DRAFT_1603885 [Flagelloscypha sp. PMI_526]
MQYPSTRATLYPILSSILAWLTFFFNSTAGKLEENIREISIFWRAIWLLDNNDIPDEKPETRRKRIGFRFSKLPGSLTLGIRMWVWRNMHFRSCESPSVEVMNLADILAYRQWNEEAILDASGASPLQMANILMSRITYSGHPLVTLDQVSQDLEILQYFVEAREEDADLPDFRFGKPCPNIRRALVQRGVIKSVVVALLNSSQQPIAASSIDESTRVQMEVEFVQIAFNVIGHLVRTGDGITSVRQALKAGFIDAFATCIPHIHRLDQKLQTNIRDLVTNDIFPLLHLPSLHAPLHDAAQSFQSRRPNFWKSWERSDGMDCESVASWKALVLSFGQKALEVKVILSDGGPSFQHAVARCCYNPQCRAEGPGVSLKCCSRCRMALYCSIMCQKADRTTHKKLGCFEARESTLGFLPSFNTLAKEQSTLGEYVIKTITRDPIRGQLQRQYQEEPWLLHLDGDRRLSVLFNFTGGPQIALAEMKADAHPNFDHPSVILPEYPSPFDEGDLLPVTILFPRGGEGGLLIIKARCLFRDVLGGVSETL